MSTNCIYCNRRMRSKSRKICSYCDSGKRRKDIDGNFKLIIIILSFLALCFTIGFKLTIAFFLVIGIIRYYLKWKKKKKQINFK